MKYRQQAAPEYTIDADGQRLAHVALARTDQRATMYAEDLAQVLAAGWSPHWSLANTGGRFRYVLVYARNPKGRGRSLTVARLIAGVGKGQLVKYADGDRLNLRRENLLVQKGTAWTPLEAIRPRKEPLSSAHHSALPHPHRDAAVLTGTPRAPREHPAAYTSRVVDCKAIDQRVREQMAAAGSVRP